MLDIKNLIKQYNLHLLYNFNMKLNKGEIALLQGPSGSGKTTLLRCVAGLERFSGELNINTQLSKLAYVFQENRFMPWLTIEQNLKLPLKLKKEYNSQNEEYMENLNANIILLCTKFKVLDHISKYPDEVSGGELQRLSLVQALLTKPDILLLDEPLNQLDKKTYKEVLNELFKIIRKEEITCLFVSHIIFTKKDKDKYFDIIKEF